MGVNYGLDRVRFPAPLPVGAQWRGSAEIVEVTELAGGLQVKLLVTVEVEGSTKPAVAADIPRPHLRRDIDVDRQLVAIDVHMHAERNAGEPQDPVTTELLAAAAKYFGAEPPQPTAQEVADYYRERSMLAVVFTVDDEAGMGRRRIGNQEVLDAARANPDVLIPFGSVDPHKGKLGVREARELIDAGVRGFKFHPNTQAFWPNDREHLSRFTR